MHFEIKKLTIIKFCLIPPGICRQLFDYIPSPTGHFPLTIEFHLPKISEYKKKKRWAQFDVRGLWIETRGWIVK